MTPKELTELGIPKQAHAEAYALVRERRAESIPFSMIAVLIKDIVANPELLAKKCHDSVTGALAQKIIAVRDDPGRYAERAEPAPHQIWGDHSTIEAEAIQQLEAACRLPSAHRAALMPDAHFGYGLPIGGVLAT